MGALWVTRVLYCLIQLKLTSNDCIGKCCENELYKWRWEAWQLQSLPCNKMCCRYSRLRKRSSTWHTPNTQVTSMATTSIRFWMPQLSCRRSTTRRVVRSRRSSTELKECPVTWQVWEQWARVASGKSSSHSGKRLRHCSLKIMERQITRLNCKTTITSTTLVRSTSEHPSKHCGWYGTPAVVNFWLSHRTVKIARAPSFK